uniref:Putative secreted protein n=1 Tax=Anopheles darlingi TaxID=43151 RepID=A0A2M4D978_ANODA
MALRATFPALVLMLTVPVEAVEVVMIPPGIRNAPPPNGRADQATAEPGRLRKKVPLRMMNPIRSTTTTTTAPQPTIMIPGVTAVLV